MMESIGLTIYPNTNQVKYILISEPFEPKHKAFSFLNLSKELWTCDELVEHVKS